MKLILRATIFLSVLSAFLIGQSSAVGVIYGPNLVSSELNSNVTTDYYVLTTESPDPMDIFEWQNTESWNGGFDSGISSAQPLQMYQNFLSASIPLSFEFPFFGQTFESIQVSLNGWISFETNLPIKSVADSARNPDLISLHPQRYVLCPYWSPLNQTLENGVIYCKYIVNNGIRGFSVQWHDVQTTRSLLETSLFFQCVFFEDGDIKFQYWSMGTKGDGSNATIGLKIDDKFVEFSRNSSSICDGMAIEFVSSLTPPPLVKRTHAITNPLQVSNTQDEGIPIFHFFVEPRLSDGTIDTLTFRVDGHQNSNTPPQRMYLYLLRDYDGQGAFNPNLPIVSGVNSNGNPIMWNAWTNGDSVDIELFDSDKTPDGDNTVERDEGRKYYYLMAVFSDLLLGDEYDFQITSLNSSDIGTSDGYTLCVNGGTIEVSSTYYPFANGPYVNPPVSSFTVKPGDINIPVLSFSVLASDIFNSRVSSFTFKKIGDAPGNRLFLRVFIDNGTRGIYDPEFDEDITASGFGASTTSAEGYYFSDGGSNQFIEIPLVNCEKGEDLSEAPTYLAESSGYIRILVLCDFRLTSDYSGTSCTISLAALDFSGEQDGTLNLLLWGIDGSTISIILPEDVLSVLNAPAYVADTHEFVVPGASDVKLGWFSAYPSSMEGHLTAVNVVLTGSGADNTEIENLEIILDVNQNGQKDPDDWILLSAPLSTDNPVLCIPLTGELGAFYPWEGNSESDLANLLTFLVLADFSMNAVEGHQFRLSTSTLTFQLEEAEPVTIDAIWYGPRIEIVKEVSPYFTVSAFEGSNNTTVHTLPNTRINGGTYRFYSGGTTSVIRSIGFSLPLQAWQKLTHFSVYADANNDKIQQTEETLASWHGIAGHPPTNSEVYFISIGNRELLSGESFNLSVTVSFAGKPDDLSSFTLTMEKVSFCTLSDHGTTWFSPLSPNEDAYTFVVVDSSDEGGSLGMIRGTSLSVGTPSFVGEGVAPLNLTRIVTGNVETIKLTRIGFVYSGSLNPTADYCSLMRVIIDDGNGIYDSETDTIVPGSFEQIANGMFYFYPSSLYFYSTGIEYLLLDAVLTSDTPEGSYLKIDLDPSLCLCEGIYYSQMGNAVIRETGDAPAIYGSKVQGSTVYFGSPTSSSDNDTSQDGGNPYETSGGGGGGCFIATTAFGSMCYDCVTILCAVRDDFAMSSRYTIDIVELYYTISPSLARGLSTATRGLLRHLLSLPTEQGIHEQRKTSGIATKM